MNSPFCHSPRNVRQLSGNVNFNGQIAAQTFHLSLTASEALPEIAAGQFVMLRLPKRTDPLLGRPLAVYRNSTHHLEVVYLVVGKMTARLSEIRPSENLELWTPLGNGFPENDVQHTILVAGGIGQTPFLKLAERLVSAEKKCTLLYGARTKERIACMESFQELGIKTVITTDDGSEGTQGIVTDWIEKVYRKEESTQIFCCGPQPMLQSAFTVAKKLKLPCSVSLETPMSCGLGICFGCAVKVRSGKDGWDYRRTCIDGPVFDAYQLF